MTKACNLITSDIVDIKAPASLVWQVLTDLPRYPEWNPYTVKVESTLQIGAPVYLHVPKIGKGLDDLMVYVEHLCDYQPEQLLSWEKRPSAEDKNAARRDQYIERTGDTTCRYYTTDQFLGINADLIMRNAGAYVQMHFNNVAHAVKKRAEALYAAQQAQA